MLQKVVPAPGVFRKGEKPFVTTDFNKLDGDCRPFFLYLAAGISSNYNKPGFWLNLEIKLVVKLCFFYYRFGQAFGPGGHHMQITP